MAKLMPHIRPITVPPQLGACVPLGGIMIASYRRFDISGTP